MLPVPVNEMVNEFQKLGSFKEIHAKRLASAGRVLKRGADFKTGLTGPR